jgi:hypothetical protein
MAAILGTAIRGATLIHQPERASGTVMNTAVTPLRMTPTCTEAPRD